MRFTTNAQRGMLPLSLAVALFVSACSTTTASTLGPSPKTPTVSASATAPTTVTATTALCDLMSLSQVGGVVGGTLTLLERGATTANGNTAVNCTYLPTQGNGERLAGEISYLFSPSGPASYAANKKDDASRGETETDLSGLGDAAFWAVAAKNPNTLQLSVLKGNVLLIMTLLGANPDGSTMLNGTISLAKLALPSI